MTWEVERGEFMLLLKDREILKLDKKFLQARIEMLEEEGRTKDVREFKKELRELNDRLRCKLLRTERR